MTDANPVEELLRQARRCAQTGEFPRAIQYCKAALERDEPRIEIHKMLASLCFQTKDYPGSVTHFTRVLQLNPQETKTLINLGAVYNRMGEAQLAIDVLRRGIQKNPQSSEGYYNLGIAYKGMGQSSMAISAYREAVRLDPTMADAHQNLANVYSEMGNNQHAMMHYKKALEINPKFERARAGLAKSQAAATEATSQISPFGRLVDEKKYLIQQQTEQATRQLTPEERREDRRKLYQFTSEIRAIATTYVEQLNEEVAPAILSLNRAIPQASGSPFAMERAYEQFQAATTKSQELRRLLKRKLLELRAHEEMINTPEINPGN